MSAHYWDPIELYGHGDPTLDMSSVDYYGQYWVPGDDEIVYFDGGMKKITGLTILNKYDKVKVHIVQYSSSNGSATAGATGLFSFVYKARIANVNLVSPNITLNEASGFNLLEGTSFESVSDSQPYINVADVAGSIAGVSHNSRIVNTHVSNPQLSYTAEFGEFLNGDGKYYLPNKIMVGGLVGHSSGSTFVVGDSIKGGALSVNPVVSETAAYSYQATSGNGINVGGVVGLNTQSVVMSSCGGSDIAFSDSGFAAPLGAYEVTVGGIVGRSNSMESFRACIYNSCSHSEISFDASVLSGPLYAGGIVGYIAYDSLINNFYDGKISSTTDLKGEIAGYASINSTDGYSMASNYYLADGVGPGTINVSADLESGATSVITTTEKLLEDLDAGRQLVVADSSAHAAGGLSQEFIAAAVNAWEIQDGTRSLDCVGKLGVGLVFPNNNVPADETPITPGVPDTGRR